MNYKLKFMITAEVSVVPLGVGTSVSGEVRKFIQKLRKSGLRVMPGPMCTAVEAGSVKDLFDAVEKAHNSLFEDGTKRVITTIKIDDRRDKDSRLKQKLDAIERSL